MRLTFVLVLAALLAGCSREPVQSDETVACQTSHGKLDEFDHVEEFMVQGDYLVFFMKGGKQVVRMRRDELSCLVRVNSRA